MASKKSPPQPLAPLQTPVTNPPKPKNQTAKPKRPSKPKQYPGPLAPLQDVSGQVNQPGDSINNPANSRDGLAPGKFYKDPTTGDIMVVSGPGYIDAVVIKADQEQLSGYSEMNPYDQAIANYNDSTDLLAQAKELLKGFFPTGTASPQYDYQRPAEFMGMPVLQSDLESIIKNLEKQNVADKKVVDDFNKKLKPLNDKIEKLKSQIKNNTNKTQEELRAGDTNYTPEQVKKLQDQITAATKQIDVVKTGIKPGAPAKQQTAAPVTTPAREVINNTPIASTTQRPTRGIGATAAEMQAAGVPSPRNAAQPVATPVGATATAKNPSARNRIGAGSTVVPGSTGAAPPPPAGGDATQPAATGKINEEALKKQFPGYEWVFNLGPQYKDTKDLYIQMLLGPEKGGITNERFQQLLPYSSFFKDQKVISATRKINSTFGNLGLSGESLAKVINDSINFQYDDTELSQAFYSEVFKKDPLTNKYVNESSARAAFNGTAASNLRSYAKSMFMLGGDPNSMNTDIENILTGKMSEEDWQRSIRTTAKAVYTNWANVLDDPSMTMERITKPWRDIAASVLEMDANQIDMSKPEYAAAFNGTDANGNPKSMSLGDWTVKLRTDPQYGWKNTQGAKQEARNLAYNLSVAFGKII